VTTSDANLEDHRDPALYDLEDTEFEPDGPFYISLAREIGGRVLE
jgi:hypothetical protein